MPKEKSTEEKKVFEVEIVSDEVVEVDSVPLINPEQAFKNVQQAKSKLTKFGVVFLLMAALGGYIGATTESTFLAIISIMGSGVTGMLGMFMLLVVWRLRNIKLPGMQ